MRRLVRVKTEMSKVVSVGRKRDMPNKSLSWLPKSSYRIKRTASCGSCKVLVRDAVIAFLVVFVSGSDVTRVIVNVDKKATRGVRWYVGFGVGSGVGVKVGLDG